LIKQNVIKWKRINEEEQEEDKDVNQKDYAEPIPCTNETGKYIQTDSNKYYRIECK